MQTPQQLFEMYLNARRPIIYIRNFDFQSVDRLIEASCKDYQIEEYSEADGYPADGMGVFEEAAHY